MSGGDGGPPAGQQPCNECGKSADPVHRAAGTPGGTPILRGWFCPSCGHFEPAIGRERGLGVGDKP